MVDWLSGNRVRGLSTERTSTTGFNDGFTGVGGWKELGRDTLESSADIMTVSSLPDKRYYMWIMDGIPTGALDDINMKMGNGSIDTLSNYASRRSSNGGTHSQVLDTTGIKFDGGHGAHQRFTYGYISNLAGEEKLMQCWEAHGESDGQRFETVGKWDNVIDPLDTLSVNNIGGGSFDTGSEFIVLGWDDADTHTTNFWEELGSAEWSSGSTLPTVSFTAKKYLWVQYFTSGGIGGDGANRVSLRVGNGSINTGGNYTFRNSENGGAPPSGTTGTDRWLTHTGHKKNFTNMFIVNSASNEKLAIYHTSEGSGTGAGSAVGRIEGVGKWNVSSQINRISVFDYTGGNSFNAGIIKVWGSD